MPDSRPIGVFDSGLGGLTVVQSLQSILPNESIVYFGDTARVPYGNKSKDLIQEYSKEITDFLINHDAKMIVVACNTASALALKSLQAQHSTPIVGVIKPGAVEAIKATHNNHIGIIGTTATISSQAYEKALAELSNTIKTTPQACPLLVHLAEEGWLAGEVTESIVNHYLESLNNADVDTLILGCTHYPLLKDVIAGQLKSGTTLVDSADAVAKAVLENLKTQDLLNNSAEKGSLTCFVTDVPMRFESIGERFLGAPIDQVQTVHDI